MLSGRTWIEYILQTRLFFWPVILHPLPVGNTGKNWVHRFFNVPKARKSKLGVWGNNTYYVNDSY